MTSVPTAVDLTEALAEHTSRGRHRLRSAVALGAVLAMVASPVALLAVSRGTAPADGTMTYPGSWSKAGVPLQEATGAQATADVGCKGDASLATGDVVVAVDGTGIVRGVGSPESPSPAREVLYQVTRGDQTCTFTVSIGTFPWLDRVRAHLPVFALVIVMWVMGAFVFLQRPRDPAAQALFAMAFLVPFGGAAWPFGMQVVDLLDGSRWWPFFVSDAFNALLWGAVLHFALVFPRPVPILRRHAALVAGVYLFPVVLYAVYVGSHELLVGDTATDLERMGYRLTVSRPSAVVVPVLAAAAMAWQLVHSESAAERRRVRWVVYTLVASAAAYLLLGQAPSWFGEPVVPFDWILIMFLGVPIALGAAVLRYGLFDLQILLGRSLVYGSLTVLLVAVPLLTAIAVMTAVRGDVPDADDPAALNIVLGTALVVALFYQTLRRGIRRRVSRFVFGDRDDPYEVVTQLGAQFQTKAPTDTVMASIVHTVGRALRLPFVAVEITSPDGSTVLESSGERPALVQSLPLISHGEIVGRLLLGPGARSEPFGPADRKLLELLAQQVAIATENVVLTDRLQRALERAVSTREEERRRLRRDIHDGLGPLLTAGRMRIEVAQQLLRTDPDRAAALLHDLVATQQMVIDDVRRLVDNLRPPVLDQLGLVGAIRERAAALTQHSHTRAGALTILIETAGDLDGLPAAVEVATYRIVLEAITNVTRHASATTCTVRLVRGSTVEIEVIDDGRGMPAEHRSGVGLQSMQERALELAGHCNVGRGVDGGTVVRTSLPIHVPDPER